jgi:hypothetical protein
MNLTPEKNDFTQDANLCSLEAFKYRKFKLKSTGSGPPGPLNLEAMVLCNELEFNSRNPDKPPLKRNLSKEETRALIDLERDSSIVIKPAYKGSAVVVQDRLDYLKDGYRQLGEPIFYREVDEDLTEKHRLENSRFHRRYVSKWRDRQKLFGR